MKNLNKILASVAILTYLGRAAESGISVIPKELYVDNSSLTAEEKLVLRMNGCIEREGYCSEQLEYEIERLDSKTFVVPFHQADEKGKIKTYYEPMPIEEVYSQIPQEKMKEITRMIEDFLKSPAQEIELDVPYTQEPSVTGEELGKLLINLYSGLDFECHSSRASTAHLGCVEDGKIKLKKNNFC